MSVLDASRLVHSTCSFHAPFDALDARARRAETRPSTRRRGSSVRLVHRHDVEVRPFDVLDVGLFHSTSTSVLDASRLHSSVFDASRLVSRLYDVLRCSAMLPCLLRLFSVLASCLVSSSSLFCRLGSWLPALCRHLESGPSPLIAAHRLRLLPPLLLCRLRRGSGRMRIIK